MGASGQPIQVDGYIIQGATNCGGDQVQIAATIAHEFGHVLGLPDYYHPVGGITPENRRWVLGCWELMAAGAWGCGPVGATRSAFGPTHMTAWNRYRMGWLDFQDVGTVRDSTFTLDPIRTTGQVLRIPLEDDVQGPVLLVEYRDHEGFDADTPAEGVLVVRIDPDGELRPRTGFRYFASLLEADDDSGLLEVLAEGGDRGAATDVFGRPGHTRLNGMTSPSTRSPGGVPNGVAFHEIAFAGGQATIRLSTDREPEIEEASGDLTGRAGRPLELEFQISGGIMPYAPRFDLSGGASLTSPPTEVSTLAGLQVTADQDRLRITGAPLVDGPVRLPIVVDDLLGNRDYVEYTLMVDPFEPVFADLAAALLGASGGLTQSELDLLDYQGNGNQILDVGDLRAWRYRGSN